MVCFLLYSRIQSITHMYLHPQPLRPGAGELRADRRGDARVSLVRGETGNRHRHHAGGHQSGRDLLPPGRHLADHQLRLAQGHDVGGRCSPSSCCWSVAFVIRNSSQGPGPACRLGIKTADSGRRRGGRPDIELAGLSYGEALRTMTFWALAFAAMTTFYSILGAQAHLFLYLRDLEFSPQVASTGISLLFGMALFGKFGFGYLADKIQHKKVFYGNLAVMLTGAVLLATVKVELFWIAVVLFGLGWGRLLHHAPGADRGVLRAQGRRARSSAPSPSSTPSAAVSASGSPGCSTTRPAATRCRSRFWWC